MARIRSIHPEACESDDLARISDAAERTWWRLLIHTDDEGRGKDHPQLLASKLYPVVDSKTATDVDRHMWEFVAAGLLIRYEVSGQRLYWVATFEKWQKPKRKVPSKLAAYDPNSDGCSRRVPPMQGACHPHAPPVVGEGEGVGGGELLGGAHAPLTTDATPTKPLNGWTYSRTLGTWAEANGMPCPDTATTRSARGLWLLDVLHKTLPADTDHAKQAGRNTAAKVVADYLADVTGRPLQNEGWALLGRTVKEVGSVETLRSVAVACESGAGLSPPHDTDPLALFKYAMKVRSNGVAR